jgi:hypothetical protein
VTPATNRSPDVPLPSWAEEVYDWHDLGTPDTYRIFGAPSRTVPADDDARDQPWNRAITVRGQGVQYANGRIRPEIQVDQLHADYPISVRQARQLAAALVAAADEVEH